LDEIFAKIFPISTVQGVTKQTALLSAARKKLVTFKETYLAALTNGRARDCAEVPQRDKVLGHGIRLR